MTTRTKTTLIAIGTLLLGMLLGALLTGAVVRHRLSRLDDLRTQRGFARILEQTIRPTDEAQREALRPVLRQGGRRVLRLRRQQRREMHALVDSVRTDLAPLLTPEQQQRLDRRIGMARQRLRPPGAPLRTPRRRPRPDSPAPEPMNQR